MDVSGHAILLVEDNAIIAMDETEALERAGCTVVGPHTRLSRAFDAVGTDHIDAAVLDITVGDRRVYPLADLLDRLNVPFIFVTGYASCEEIPVRFRTRPVLTKPFLHSALTDALTGILPPPPAAA